MLNENHLLLAVWGNGVKKMNLETMKEENLFDPRGKIYLQVCVSPCGRFIAAGGDEFKLIDAKTNTQLVQLTMESNWITDMRISCDYVF